jgi:hypothetical protein
MALVWTPTVDGVTHRAVEHFKSLTKKEGSLGVPAPGRRCALGSGKLHFTVRAGEQDACQRRERC